MEIIGIWVDEWRHLMSNEFGVIAARGNCSPKLGVLNEKAADKGRCPHCKRYHLRPGYCPALNPEASKAIIEGAALTLAEARRLAKLPEPTEVKPSKPRGKR